MTRTRTVTDRLAQLHAGSQITRDSLELVRKEMQVVMTDLRDMVDELEANFSLIDDHAAVLIGPDGSRDERSAAWQQIQEPAHDALAVLRQIEGWEAIRAGEPREAAEDLGQWRARERGAYHPSPG